MDHSLLNMLSVKRVDSSDSGPAPTAISKIATSSRLRSVLHNSRYNVYPYTNPMDQTGVIRELCLEAILDADVGRGTVLPRG